MVSKKASKKFNKAQSKVSAKAKQKAKLTEKIKRRDEIKESKRKAKLTEAELEGAEEEEDMDAELNAQLADIGSDDEAVFCVPDGMDGEEELVEALNEGEEEKKSSTGERAEGDEADTHMKELEALKETDPEFYKFLQETDQDLLEFGQGEEVEQGSEAKTKKPKTKADTGVLTMELLNQLTEAAEGKKDGNKSLKALRAVLSAYRVASRMIRGEAKEGGESEEVEGSATGVRIEDAAVFNAVLEWTLKKAPELLDYHDKQVAKAKGKEAASGGGKTYMLGRMFWSESLSLLQQLTDLDTQEFVLWQLSDASALKYLMPLKKLKPLVINELCRKWAKGAAQGTKLAAFSALYNLVGHILKNAASSKKGTEAAGREVEGIMRRMYRAYVVSLQRVPALTHRQLSACRFMENCIAEMLTLEPQAAYRIAFTSIRQLGVILRSAMKAQSKGIKSITPGQVGGSKASKAAAGGSAGVDSVRQLYSVCYVRSSAVWVAAMERLPEQLKDLLHPLMVILLCAAKSKEGHTVYLPFVLHMLELANCLAEKANVFAPLTSLLLRGLSNLAAKEKQQTSTRRSAATSTDLKPTQVDLVVRVSERQLDNRPTSQALRKYLLFVLTHHLALLARSPSYPEITTPLMTHLRRLQKSNLAVKHELKPLISLSEETAAQVTRMRSSLRSPPEQFMIYSYSDTAMGKAYVQQQKQREEEEKSKIEAMMKGDQEIEQRLKRQRAEETGEAEDGPERSKRSLKRQRQKEKKRQAWLAAQTAAAEAIGEAAQQDSVHEMTFSDSEGED
ncbi:Immediate-early protein, putative [Perkinsus marinus ATCC 50983]|uniref:Immediate-early protein, putative n=1 Tax=Perkinsus marinus (strain ATCC 50983 / TXsc) TaxID=423536 RepID=C5LFB0_PERM5|nr:Immediate-early protein, putative [Perkinsus marinus ATCC 50983]EER04625.1 Immediate-early protein, putative [Perkinsus marinus ATCC 50983]|eukprot:XP_002772809.1 Immediate-early protein, putative [Perkinsus marinus ATCC 50983]